MINTQPQKVIISPIGKRDNELIELIAAEIESVFGHKTKTIPLLDSVDFAFDPVRRQYHSTPILEKLSALAPSQAMKVLGIVQDDLFIPILTHVYGEAQLGGRACMVSTYRLREGLSLAGSRGAYQRRVVKKRLSMNWDIPSISGTAAIARALCTTAIRWKMWTEKQISSAGIARSF